MDSNKKKHKKEYLFEPSNAIPPGETLLEIIQSVNITQAELAQRMGRPIKFVNEIIKGKATITPETTLQLEKVLGKPASFWNNLEAIYQELKAREELKDQLKDMILEANKYPYTEMANLDWVPRTKNSLEKVENLLKFFSVTSFENIIERARAAFSISSKHRYSAPAIYAWLRQGVREIENLDIETKDFDKTELIKTIPIIKTLTKENPEIFIPKLKKIFAECGIAFTVVKSLTNMPVFGSTRWLSPNKALIQLSIRLKWADVFWFNLFHEIGHILLGNKRDFNVDFLENNVSEEIEKTVINFARETLIEEKLYENFRVAIQQRMKNKMPIYPVIRGFAYRINIHPGIVVGRLQHDEVIPPTFNRLRVKLEWRGS